MCTIPGGSILPWTRLTSLSNQQLLTHLHEDFQLSDSCEQDSRYRRNSEPRGVGRRKRIKLRRKLAFRRVSTAESVSLSSSSRFISTAIMAWSNMSDGTFLSIIDQPLTRERHYCLGLCSTTISWFSRFKMSLFGLEKKPKKHFFW